ncbi:hypothetical protein [Arthrobacter globiformis]|uniref:Uncharacterized protein n=1 Tax=Arthrobacter globiformis TaxID=1665 RepID=A0A328HKG4_ARTGO|nr:hypothetical protein [Arthrobacter globiformis]RAM37710.1 hypothetical protein DBZ45_08910 [Arthrobacter globiformis]
MAGVVVCGVIINWLSGIWAPAAPVVILLALASLPLFAMSEGSRLEHSPGLAWIASVKRDGLLELCLAALVLGFVIASISIIPVWPTVHLEAPSPAEPFGFGGDLTTTNYEVGAVTAIVLMVTVAAYRARSPLRQTAFLVCALYGVAVSYTYFRPKENSFLPTFGGGLLIAATLTVILTAMPRMYAVVKSFWGFGEKMPSPASDESAHEGTVPPSRETES